MRFLGTLSLVFLALALFLQLLVVRSPESGVLERLGGLEDARAQARLEASGEAAGDAAATSRRAARRRILADERQELRGRIESALGGRLPVPGLALGALALGLVLWGAAVMSRGSARPPHGLNAVLLACFCVVRWLDFL